MRDPMTTFAEAHPEKPAVIEDLRVLSYAAVEVAANRLGRVLQGLGVLAGTKVVWCGKNSADVVVLINALRKCGAIAVPLNYRLFGEEAAYVIENSDAAVVVFDVEQATSLAACRARCGKVRHWLSFGDGASKVSDWAPHLPALAACEDGAPVDPIGTGPSGGMMIYTSGTTGKPKGAVRQGPAKGQTGAELVRLIGFEPSDVYMTTGPLYHSGPLGIMAVVQSLGGTVVVQRTFDPAEWLRLIEAHRVTVTFAAPTPIRRVLDLADEIRARYDYSSMRRFLANAAPWPFELKRRYIDAFGPGTLWELYGSTELGINTVLKPDDQLRKPGSCGQPAPLVEIALFDETGRRIDEPMVPGELFVRSLGTFDAYYKAPEKDHSGRRGDWLTVGDIAYRDADGYFYICDRKSDMIISGGVNIYSAEVEAVLFAHPAVADAAVFGVPDEEWGEAVHAAVTVYDDRTVTDEELVAFMRETLPGYKVPRGFTRMEEIPRTASGKILKRELRALFAGRG